MKTFKVYLKKFDALINRSVVARLIFSLVILMVAAACGHLLRKDLSGVLRVEILTICVVVFGAYKRWSATQMWDAVTVIWFFGGLFVIVAELFFAFLRFVF